MRIEIEDEIGPLSKITVTLFGPKNKDESIQTYTQEFRVPDETVTKLEKLYEKNPQKVYDFIMKKASDVNPVKIMIIGASPALKGDGKLLDKTFDDTTLDVKE